MVSQWENWGPRAGDTWRFLLPTACLGGWVQTHVGLQLHEGYQLVSADELNAMLFAETKTIVNSQHQGQPEGVKPISLVDLGCLEGPLHPCTSTTLSYDHLRYAVS